MIKLIEEWLLKSARPNIEADGFLSMFLKDADHLILYAYLFT